MEQTLTLPSTSVSPRPDKFLAQPPIQATRAARRVVCRRTSAIHGFPLYPAIRGRWRSRAFGSKSRAALRSPATPSPCGRPQWLSPKLCRRYAPPMLPTGSAPVRGRGPRSPPRLARAGRIEPVGTPSSNLVPGPLGSLRPASPSPVPAAIHGGSPAARANCAAISPRPPF